MAVESGNWTDRTAPRVTAIGRPGTVPGGTGRADAGRLVRGPRPALAGWLAGLVALALAGGALAATPPEPIPPGSALADALAGADVVVLGEIHDDPAHHALQAAAIDHMVALGRRPTVVFEMIPADLQPALDAHRAAAPEDVDGLGAVLRWTDRGWGDFALYAPVFGAAVSAGLPIRAGDLEDAEKRAAGRTGADGLDPARAAALGLDQDLDPAAEADLAETLRVSHCGMLPETAIAPMIRVQRARDGAMAAAVMAAAAEGPVVLIAGQGHARRDWGVPAVLARQAPTLTVRAFALAADGADPGDAAFDGTVRTGPPPERGDPCEAFRK